MTNYLNELKLYGLKGRANNTNPVPIGILWQKFVQVKPAGECYGIYTNYESDYTGDYDFILATPTEFTDAEEVNLPAGNYLVFDVEDGQEGVLKVWQEIWQMSLNRVYTSDFEHYQADGQVKIYIAVKD
ncbi:GyrI-like domain-containing protein [Carnobacterium gallinarum]|uniref:GyrI-like domain-containing protein n=1 Tax=Carnobacterium gallinarum TaxID=2749 RepID=UPI0005516B9A|nr:effector binding domain-containing protein [Carnobacterium gallinarum]